MAAAIDDCTSSVEPGWYTSTPTTIVESGFSPLMLFSVLSAMAVLMPLVLPFT